MAHLCRRTTSSCFERIFKWRVGVRLLKELEWGRLWLGFCALCACWFKRGIVLEVSPAGSLRQSFRCQVSL